MCYRISVTALYHISVINFSDDNDHEPDSSGEYTGASLRKPDLPMDFTICAAYMVEGMAKLFTLNNEFGDWWSFLQIFALDINTEFTVNLGPQLTSQFWALSGWRPLMRRWRGSGGMLILRMTSLILALRGRGGSPGQKIQLEETRTIVFSGTHIGQMTNPGWSWLVPILAWPVSRMCHRN